MCIAGVHWMPLIFADSLSSLSRSWGCLEARVGGIFRLAWMRGLSCGGFGRSCKR